MTSNKNATRYYSAKQEKSVAKSLKGKLQSNSGATAFCKGDILSKNFLVECKTVMTPKQSVSLRQEWLTKLNEEKFAMGKEYFCLAFNFEPDGQNYFVIDQKTFVALTENLEVEN